MKIKKKPEAIFLDLDGVLLDTEALNGEAWRKAAKYFGKDLSRKELNNLLGRPRMDCAREVLALINKPLDISDLLKIHLPYQKDLIRSCLPIKDAENLVRFIKEKFIPTALVTSSSFKSVNYKISLHPWINDIDLKILGDDPLIKFGKPSPDPYLLASEKFNIKPSSCWVIEDSEAGIKSALDANCQVWALKTISSNKKTNICENPTYISNLKSIIFELKKYF